MDSWLRNYFHKALHRGERTEGYAQWCGYIGRSKGDHRYAISAIAEARARVAADDLGIEIEWEPDFDGFDLMEDHEEWCPVARRNRARRQAPYDMYGSQPHKTKYRDRQVSHNAERDRTEECEHECWGAKAMLDGECLDSLWGIDSYGDEEAAWTVLSEAVHTLKMRQERADLVEQAKRELWANHFSAA